MLDDIFPWRRFMEIAPFRFMKTKPIALIFLAVTALAIMAALAIHQQVGPTRTFASPTATEQIFDVKGRVVSIEADGKTIHIAHENIPDFMPPMTMPFSVKDAELIRGLAAGDQVKFQ